MGDFLATIHNPSPAPQLGSESGFAVAANNNYIAVGAPLDDALGMSDVGRVHVYDANSGTLLHVIDNPWPYPNDRFGQTLAMSEELLAVGVPFNDAGGADSGMVHLFDPATGNLQRTLNSPNQNAFDYFGSSVDVHGNRVVVGAYLDDAAGLNSGAAFVFSTDTGKLLRTLHRPNAASSDYFGFSVAISADKVVVGAERVNIGATHAGAAYVFSLANGTLLHELLNPTPANLEYFGHAVAIDAETLVVSAHRDGTGAPGAGSAYVYNAQSGSLVHTLNNPAPAFVDFFGSAVAVAGDTIVVGVPRADFAGTQEAGRAYQFSASSGSLVRTFNNPTPADLDAFGAAVTVAGDRIAIGAHRDDSVAFDAGNTYVYHRTTGLKLFDLPNPTESSFDYFGYAVAVSSNYVVVGAPLDDALAIDSGAVYIFDATTNQLMHTIHSPLPQAQSNFGISVAVSGQKLVVGAYRATVGAIAAGQAYVFDLVSGNLISTLVNPSPSGLDYFGFSVAISGSRAAVGAYQDDAGATDAGSVYVFDAYSGLLLYDVPHPSPNAFANFGFSIALNYNYLVVGAYRDNTAANQSGRAFVFDAETGLFMQALENPDAQVSDFFGYAVSVSGTTIAVGAPRKDYGQIDAGAVFMYHADTGSLLNVLDDPTAKINGNLGSSLSIANNMLLAGAYQKEIDGVVRAGAANLFDLTTGLFIGELTNPHPVTGDIFGWAVAANEDFLVIGAPLVDGLTTDRGAAYIFDARSNAPPNADSGGPYVGAEGTTVTFDASASSDPDEPQDNLVFAWDFDYDGGTFHIDAEGIIVEVGFMQSFAPRQMAVRVTDSQGAFSIAVTTLEILNLPPEVSVDEPLVTTDEGMVATNTGSVSDPGQDPVALSASIGAVLDLGDGTWSWTYTTLSGPADSQVVTITATDDDGANSFVTFDLVVANLPPEIVVDQPLVTADEGTVATNTGSVSDPGQDPVTLSTSIGDVVDHGDGTWSWTYTTLSGPADSQIVTITATDDDGASSFVTFDLVVENLPPQITVNEPLVTTDEGTQATNTGSFSDPGQDPVTLSASIGDVVDQGDGTWSWSFTTLSGPASSQLVTITATDVDGGSTWVTFDLVVENLPPVILVDESIITVSEGATAVNSGSVADPGGDPINLMASVGTVIDLGDGRWFWYFVTSDKSESQMVTITATDDLGASSQITFELAVDPSQPVVLPNQALIEVDEGASATNSGSYADPGGGSVTLSASVGFVMDNGDGTWSWSYSTLSGPADSQLVTITAQYDGITEYTASFVLLVNNLPPTISVSDTVVTVTQGSVATNSGTFSDPGDDPMTLNVSVGTAIDNGDGTWSWNFETVAGMTQSQTVTITATDSFGAASFVTFELEVQPLSPEIAVSLDVVNVRAGGLATNTGTYAVYAIGTVSITASVGDIVDHGDETWSWSYLTDQLADDTQDVTVTIEDGVQSTSWVVFSLVDLPGIEQVVVGDGTAQRSIVNQIQIYFDALVEIDERAFVIETLNGSMAAVDIVWTQDVVDGRSLVTITFTGSFSENGTGSLTDGSYRLTIDGDFIRRAGTQIRLDADGNVEEGGIFYLGNEPIDNFYRLFGDVDGDRDVDLLDLEEFLLTFGSVHPDTSYDYRFDADGDGDVDIFDRVRFNRNFRRDSFSDVRDPSNGNVPEVPAGAPESRLSEPSATGREIIDFETRDQSFVALAVGEPTRKRRHPKFNPGHEVHWEHIPPDDEFGDRMQGEHFAP